MADVDTTIDIAPVPDQAPDLSAPSVDRVPPQAGTILPSVVPPPDLPAKS